MHGMLRATLFSAGVVLSACSAVLGLTDPRVDDEVTEGGGAPPTEAASDAPIGDVDAGADADAAFPRPKSCVEAECPVVVTNLLGRNCDPSTKCNLVYGVAVQATTLFWSLVDTGTGHSVVESCPLPACASIKTYTTGGSGFLNVAGVAATSTTVYWTEGGGTATYNGLYDEALSATCFQNVASTPPCRVATLQAPLGVAADESSSTIWVSDSPGLLRCAPTCTATGVLSSRAVAVTGSDVYSATTDTIATCTDATCATAAHVADVLNLVMLAADGDDLYWTSDDVGNDGTLVTCKASACKGTMHAHAVHLGKAWGVAVDGANVYIGTNQAMGTVYAIPR